MAYRRHHLSLILKSARVLRELCRKVFGTYLHKKTSENRLVEAALTYLQNESTQNKSWICPFM
jgi:RNA polymerase-interacting CarD/CdnL/TRCF family regulator